MKLYNLDRETNVLTVLDTSDDTVEYKQMRKLTDRTFGDDPESIDDGEPTK